MVLLMTAVVGCGSSGSDDPGNHANDDQVPSAKGPYNRIKRSAPRQAAVNMQNSNYLKQIALALLNHHATYRQYPLGDRGQTKYQDGKPLLSWRVHLLPYLEAMPLYNKFKLDQRWDSPHNIQLLDQMPDLYKSLDYQGLGNKTTVVGLSGPGAVFNPNEVHSRGDIRDGLGQTILIIMAGPDKAVPWTQPVDLDYDPANLRQSLGDVGDSFLVLFADGGVQRLRATVDPKILLRLFQYSDGEKIDFQKLFP